MMSLPVRATASSEYGPIYEAYGPDYDAFFAGIPDPLTEEAIRKVGESYKPYYNTVFTATTDLGSPPFTLRRSITKPIVEPFTETICSISEGVIRDYKEAYYSEPPSIAKYRDLLLRFPLPVQSTESNITLDSKMSYDAFHSGSGSNPGAVPIDASSNSAIATKTLNFTVDLNRWPRVEMTPSMMLAYTAMKGRDLDLEHDVVHSALYNNKERLSTDIRVWLPTVPRHDDYMSAEQPAKGKSYYWDPLVEINQPTRRKAPQIEISGPRVPFAGPPNATFAEHIRFNPPANKLKDYSGNYVLAQAGYVLVNGKWVDPDSEQELSEATKNDAIQNYTSSTKDDATKHFVNNFTTNDFVANNVAANNDRKETKRDSKIYPYEPRPLYAPCQFGDNGLPPYTKYPIINGQLLTPEYEDKMYKMFMGLVSDDEGDTSDHHIAPAHFGQMAYGANFPVDYGQSVKTPKPAPATNEMWNVSTGVYSRNRLIKRTPQFDVETSSTMTGEYSVSSNPSIVLDTEGVDPWRPPHSFSRMNPAAALALDRQAYAPAFFDQYQNNMTYSIGESMPGAYTSEECKAMLAEPGFPETGETEYQDAKKQLEILDYRIYTSNKRNQELIARLNEAGHQHIALQHKIHTLGANRKGKGADCSDDYSTDSDTKDESALTRNQKKNAASRRRRDCKFAIAEAIANKNVEAQKQKVVTSKLKEEIELTLKDIFNMEQFLKALDDGSVTRSVFEVEEERAYIDRSLSQIHAEKVELETEILSEDSQA